MILLTGAAGKTGRSLVQRLAARGAPVRALAFRERHISPLRSLGAQEVAVADLRLPGEVEEAFDGVEEVYHIAPNMHPEEILLGENVLRAARRTGCRRVVYHSVLHPQTERMSHHWLKMRVEERLFESGLPFTILQPAPYLQNLPATYDRLLDHGLYSIPYQAETRLSMVDLEDVAEVAAKVLTEPGHEGATYELSGTKALTQRDVAEAMKRCLGRPIEIEEIPRPEWRERARQRGLGRYPTEALAAMFAYYEEYGLWGNPKVLTWLLGRPPRSLEEFLERTLKGSPS